MLQVMPDVYNSGIIHVTGNTCIIHVTGNTCIIRVTGNVWCIY